MPATKAFDELMHLRNLRINAAAHYAKASERIDRATHGTGTKRATNMSGTGRCPLTDNAGGYTIASEQYKACAGKANVIWERICPMLDAYDYDTRCVIELYYNQGADMQDVARSVKRSVASCEKMQAHVCLTLAI